MKQLIAIDDCGMFADVNEAALVDSRLVAKAFGKPHRNVLRSIELILSRDSGYSPEFCQQNYAPASYIDARGRMQPCYFMTRDGFTMLVMGFTGRRAAQFKEFTLSALTSWSCPPAAMCKAGQDAIEAP